MKEKKIIGINIEYYRKGPENLSIARAFIWHLYKGILFGVTRKSIVEKT